MTISTVQIDGVQPFVVSTLALAGGEGGGSSSAPTAHASSHAAGGSDPITPDSIGAAEEGHAHAAADISDSTNVGRQLLTAADAAAARAAIGAAPVSGAGVTDSSGLTLTTAHANTTRLPSGSLTYTIDGSTGWSVSDGAAVFLPASGTISFAVSGGPTINGGTSTLTRTLAGNSIGYVVLSRIAGTAAYSLSGA